MGDNPSKKKIRNGDDGGDEVEQLLRAAQDDILLKLSSGSHIARASSIDPDLDRRFKALKNPNSLPPQTTKLSASDGSTAAGDGDLFARFTALKNSITSSSNSQDSSINQQLKLTEVEENPEEDDEAEKVIKWAIDAARLDPSPPSDDDDSDEDKSDDDDNDDDDDVDDNGKKSRRK